jgi:glycosyltransferase involved in cell wall biosynthesis
MVRVKNEEEFLFASVASIADHVDEIVLVDNGSSDGTPAVIEALCERYPGKISRHSYPFEIRRVGRENWELASERSGRRSPNLSSTFYNWCLRKCTKPFVLKWDGDMIARPAFYEALDQWRRSDKPIMAFSGENVHPNRRNLIRPKVTDREALLAKLTVRGLPIWVTQLARDAREPRLFPRVGASYDDGLLWTQRLSTPFDHRDFRHRSSLGIESPCFLHMKFCKRHAFSNYSQDLREVIESNIDVGPPLSSDARSLLERFGVAGAAVAAMDGI